MEEVTNLKRIERLGQLGHRRAELGQFTGVD
jgi:hypothetical protein